MKALLLLLREECDLETGESNRDLGGFTQDPEPKSPSVLQREPYSGRA